jgi:hypothetical protein
VQSIEHRIYPTAAGWVGAGRVQYREGRLYFDGELTETPRMQTY